MPASSYAVLAAHDAQVQPGDRVADQHVWRRDPRGRDQLAKIVHDFAGRLRAVDPGAAADPRPIVGAHVSEDADGPEKPAPATDPHAEPGVEDDGW